LDRAYIGWFGSGDPLVRLGPASVGSGSELNLLVGSGVVSPWVVALSAADLSRISVGAGRRVQSVARVGAQNLLPEVDARNLLSDLHNLLAGSKQTACSLGQDVNLLVGRYPHREAGLNGIQIRRLSRPDDQI
jgi:hypothetical protein